MNPALALGSIRLLRRQFLAAFLDRFPYTSIGLGPTVQRHGGPGNGAQSGIQGAYTQDGGENDVRSEGFVTACWPP